MTLPRPEQPATAADLAALLDPENAPAVHGTWQAQENGGDNALWLSDSDGCSLLVTNREVAALVMLAIERAAAAAALPDVAELARALHEAKNRCWENEDGGWGCLVVYGEYNIPKQGDEWHGTDHDKQAAAILAELEREA